jgi:type IV secretion system protein VirD4
MQLPPQDQLLLVSGLAPIRAKKLRYYKDRNFTARVMSPPRLSEDIYADRPKASGDEWAGRVRGTDPRLTPKSFSDFDEAGAEDEGGLQHQLPLVAEHKAPEPETAANEFAATDDEADTAADKKTLDQARQAAALRRAVAISRDDDLMPTLEG